MKLSLNNVVPQEVQKQLLILEVEMNDVCEIFSVSKCVTNDGDLQVFAYTSISYFVVVAYIVKGGCAMLSIANQKNCTNCKTYFA